MRLRTVRQATCKLLFLYNMVYMVYRMSYEQDYRLYFKKLHKQTIKFYKIKYTSKIHMPYSKNSNI